MNNQNEDYKNVEAEVIGELRKDKIGKPGIAIVMIVLFGVVIGSFTIINKLLADETSFLYKFLYPSEEVVSPSDEEERYSDGSKITALQSGTKMKYNNQIIMKDFTVNKDSIDCTISSFNGLLDLDKEEYYLEIYSGSNDLVTYVKLTGSYDNSETKVTLKNNFSFNSTRAYSGKIVLMKNNNYPEVIIESDETGLGELTCKNSEQTIDYVFKNKYLIKIYDRVSVNFANDNDYATKLSEYKKKTTDLGEIARTEENSTGFTYNATIDLETYRIPDSVKDYNYFKIDSEAKVIKYNLEGKGFECE